MTTISNTDTGDTPRLITTTSATSSTEIGGSGGGIIAATMDNNGIPSASASISVTSGDAVAGVAPREALITTAVNFLQNAKVRHTTLMQKQQFLQSKGLTMDEIQIACERAGVFTQDPNKPTVINMGINSSSAQMALRPQLSAYGRIREVLHNVALLSGVAYAIYAFYKKYIEPYLYGRKKKPIEDSLEDIDKKVDTRINEVNSELAQIKETLTQTTRDHTQQMNREFNHFRSDLEAIKGLLLNRKQFASPLAGVSVPPCIPTWQLSSSPHHRLRHSQSDDNEKADDAGSGSGSSETEVVTKNSDSSLEIM